MISNSVRLRLNEATGLSFDENGVFIPFHQIPTQKSFKLKVAMEDLETLTEGLRNTQVKIDEITYQIETLKNKAANLFSALKDLKQTYKILYYTVIKYKIIVDSL